jgi:hypothetical protein
VASSAECGVGVEEGRDELCAVPPCLRSNSHAAEA